MRHAYMILAHNQERLLNLLLSRLDDERNDIIVHLDAKSDICIDSLRERIRKGKLFFADRIPVVWGGYSQIEAELILLETAKASGSHVFYHLLTGTDLPLYPIAEINRFYDEHIGKEFIKYNPKDVCLRQYELRMRYNHYFREKCGRDKNIYTVLNKLGLILQRVTGSKCQLNKADFYCGSAYWDISEELAAFVLNKRKEIQNLYQYSSCCDEVFLHTLVWNSVFRERLAEPYLGNSDKANMRWVDMKRGKNAGAYVIRKADVPGIMSSGMLFARKFDFEIAQDAVNYFIEIETNET